MRPGCVGKVPCSTEGTLEPKRGIEPLTYALRVLKNIIKTTGLPAFTFHDLRKTHATMLVEAGSDPKVIQQRMGHANIETTLKFYAQPTKDRLQAAADVATVYLRQG